MTTPKVFIEDAVKAYISRGYSPDDQPEVRSKYFFSSTNIIYEIWRWLDEIPRVFSHSEVATHVFNILRDAERICQQTMIAKVSALEVAEVLKIYQDKIAHAL